MRIIKTIRGEEVMQKLKEQDIEESINTSIILSPPINKKIGFYNSNDKLNNSPYSHRVIPTNLPQIISNKSVNVTTKKLFIPKQIADKYNSSEYNDIPYNESIIGDSLSQNFKNQTHNKSMLSSQNSKNTKRTNSFNFKESIQLKEILSPQSLQDLKQKYYIKENNNKKHPKFSMNNIRSKFPDKDHYTLNKSLNKEIDNKSVNLIKYLRNKKEVSENFIKKISYCDEPHIIRLNKICQNIFHNEVDDQIFKDKVDTILKGRDTKELSDYKNNLILMGEEISKIKEITSVERRPYKERDRYVDLHNQMIKKWDESKVDRFYIMKSKIRNNTNNSSSIWDMVDKKTSIEEIY